MRSSRSSKVQYGMQTFDQAIMGLYKRGLISFEEAMINASNPDDFDLRIKGITGSSDRWDDESHEKESPDPQNSTGSLQNDQGYQRF